MARGVDAGGSDRALVNRLRNLESAVERAEQPVSVQMQVQPPFERGDNSTHNGRRCHVLTMGRARVFGMEKDNKADANDDDYDVALGMVIQMGGKPTSAGFDTFAEASAVKRSKLDASWKVRRPEGITVKGVGGSTVMGPLYNRSHNYFYLNLIT